MLVPHDVPLGPGPLSTHTELPVEHEVVPVSHGFVGVQATPAVHAPHVPPLQTSLVPQTVPFCACVPVSVHVPVAQSSVPVWHGFAGRQEAPFMHVTHAPPWQI